MNWTTRFEFRSSACLANGPSGCAPGMSARVIDRFGRSAAAAVAMVSVARLPIGISGDFVSVSTSIPSLSHWMSHSAYLEILRSSA